MITLLRSMSGIKNGFMKWLGWALYPPVCQVCGRNFAGDVPFCKTHWADIPKTEVWRGGENSVEERLGDLDSFYSGMAYCYYDKQSAVQTLFHQFKFSDYAHPELAYELGKMAAVDIGPSGFFKSIDYIIPIPLHPKRLRERGFNQSEWIARGLSELTGIPLDLTHIRRVVNNPKQSQRNKRAREENVKGIFEVVRPSDIEGKHLLLVDDVITTGSTIRSCIMSLERCCDCRVSVFALSTTRGVGG